MPADRLAALLLSMSSVVAAHAQTTAPLNPRIDYVGMAKALGVPGELVEKGMDIGSAVKRGLASGGPYLVDVHIDGTFKN